LLRVRLSAIGIETADLLVHEVLLRNMRDRRAVARKSAGPAQSGINAVGRSSRITSNESSTTPQNNIP
jgi:hypothetical protein